MNDDIRYIEYLQDYLSINGQDDEYNHLEYLGWLESHQDLIKNLLLEISPSADFHTHVAEYMKSANEFTKKTKYSEFHASIIFERILAEIQEQCEELNLKVSRDVVIENSPSEEISPISRSGSNIILIGRSTYFFCNYWSKAISSLISEIAKRGIHRRMRRTEVEKEMVQSPFALGLCIRLLSFYGVHGHLIGFGATKIPRSAQGVRLQLLEAMEMFIVSHEYSHIYFDESCEEFRGVLSDSKNRELELYCDKLALCISQNYGRKNQNLYAFLGLGAIAALRAIGISELARELFLGKKSFQANSHPSIEVRIRECSELVTRKLHHEEKEHMMNFMSEFDLIVSTLFSMLSVALKKAATA